MPVNEEPQFPPSKVVEELVDQITELIDKLKNEIKKLKKEK